MKCSEDVKLIPLLIVVVVVGITSKYIFTSK